MSTPQPPPGSGWSNPGRLLRNYALTGGRAHPHGDLELEALVTTTSHRHTTTSMLTTEQREILQLCHQPQSIAEISAKLNLVLGVARVLVDDMHAAGLVTVHRPTHSDDRPDRQILERVLDGLRQLH